MKLHPIHGAVLALGLSPFLMAPSCGGGGDPTNVPDVGGAWSLTFADDLAFEVDIGGTIYNPTLAGGSDQITVTHDGMPVSFNVDCARDLIACPSELLPPVVTLTQARANPRSVSLSVTESSCRGGEIVEGMCTGTLVEQTSTREGSISEDGRSFTIVLGGGAAVAGSCALLTISLAEGDFTTSGSAAGGDLRAESIMNGTLSTAFGGGCLVVGMADLDPALEAAAVGASIKMTSSFTATRTGR